MKHSFRKSALESEKSYEISDAGIAITDLKSEAVKTLAFERIIQVKLGFTAKRNMPDDYYCKVRTKNGNEIAIHSQHFKGIASFENRENTYTPFIQALHSNLQDGNVTFIKGMSVTLYWVQIVFFIAMGLIMLFIAIAALIPYGILIILMLIYLFFRLKKHLGKNRPGSYSYDELPEELTPQKA